MKTQNLKERTSLYSSSIAICMYLFFYLKLPWSHEHEGCVGPSKRDETQHFFSLFYMWNREIKIFFLCFCLAKLSYLLNQRNVRNELKSYSSLWCDSCLLIILIVMIWFMFILPALIFFLHFVMTNRYIFAPSFSCITKNNKNNICHKKDAIKWVVATSLCICGNKKFIPMESICLTE